MTTKLRKDSWTQEEDNLLAQTVLEHIKNGSTQLKAFEEVANKLKNRTPAAVGFRWNAVLRETYQKDMDKLKDQKQTMKEEKKESKFIIFFKNIFKSKKIKQLEELNVVLLNENSSLKEKNLKLENKIKTVEHKYNTLKREYKSMLDIMDKAKKQHSINIDEEDIQNLA